MNVHTVLRLCSTTLQARMAWRGDWLLSWLAHATGTAAGVAIVLTLYAHSDRIAGYSRAEALVVWGFAEASRGLFWTLLGGIFVLNRRYLVGGDLDRVLLRPMSPLTHVLVENLRPEQLVTMFGGVVVLAVGASSLPGVSLVHWGLVPLFVACGALVIAGLLLLLSSLGFWLQHRGSSVGLVWEMGGYAGYPLDYVPSPLQPVLLTVVPFAFVGFAPATLYIGAEQWGPLWLAQPVVAGGLFASGALFWTWSLQRYSSSGT